MTCAREFEPDPHATTCPDCGPFHGTLDVVYPLQELSERYGGGLSSFRNRSVFDVFSDIMPFESAKNLPPVPVGGTPLFKSPNISRTTGLSDLWFKDDSKNPSASFKDRASAIAIAMAVEAKADLIAVASTGNAASSLATLASSVSLRAVVCVPRNIPKPKLVQLLIHGATVLRLDCGYDQAFDLCQQACEQYGWYSRNTAINPFTGEGKKSAAIEIAIDLGSEPDVIVCPVGDGCIIGGIYKGFSDLKGLGLVSRLPRIYGIQSKGADPIARAIFQGTDIEPIKDVSTIADSIAVGHPRDGIKAIRAAKNSGGNIIAVGDDEIMEAQKILAMRAGIFSEPAASASFAGLMNLVENREINSGEKIVVLLTGHGLKDIDAARHNINLDTYLVWPDIESIKKRLEDTIIINNEES